MQPLVGNIIESELRVVMPDVKSDVANFLGEGHTPIVTPRLHLSWQVWLESSWFFCLLPGSGFLGLLLRGILRCWRFSPPLHEREVARHIVAHTDQALSMLSFTCQLSSQGLDNFLNMHKSNS